ncbi:hypothetical protein Tco_0896898, partial [Tanacetum coccineum]
LWSSKLCVSCVCLLRAIQAQSWPLIIPCATLISWQSLDLVLKIVGLPNGIRGLVEVRVRFDPWCIGVRLSVMGRRKR